MPLTLWECTALRIRNKQRCSQSHWQSLFRRLRSMECISSTGSFLVIPQSQPGALQIHWGLCGWIARASAVWTVTPRTNYTARGTGPLRRWAMVASQGRKMTIPWKGHTRHSCPPIQAYSQSDNLNSNHDIPSPTKKKKIIFIPCQNGRLTFSISALSPSCNLMLIKRSH